MALTSDEINFLIYRYLRESGFDHSAYAFGHESFVSRSNLDGSQVPPGSLISFVQKGLQYLEIESHLTDDGSELICDESFSLLRPHVCRARNKRPLYSPYDPIDADYGGLEIDSAVRVMGAAVLMLEGREREERMRGLMTTSLCWQRDAPVVAMGGQDGRIRVWEMKDDAAATGSAGGGAEDKGGDRKRGRQYVLLRVLDDTGVCSSEEEEERKAREMRRKGHKRQRHSPSTAAAASSPPSSVSSSSSPAPSHPRSVLALDWHPRNSSLAAGLYSGDVLLFSPRGELLHTCRHHTAPITVVRWNRAGDRLLTCSVDSAVCVWTEQGRIVQQYLVHTGPVIDADWCPTADNVFCSVGTDGCVFLYQLAAAAGAGAAVAGGGAAGSNGSLLQPRKLVGHIGDVNSARFDSSGAFIATGGDDHAVRVWSRETGECQHEIREHQREVTCVRWTTPENLHTAAAASASSSLLLASSSLDCTIRLHDVSGAASRPLHVLHRHTHPVTCLSFQSGAGGLLVSGSHDRVHVWSVSDGVLVKTFRSEGEGGVNELAWDSSGRRIMVAYADSWNYLIDLKG